jgi:acyl-CoA dehydrogenase
VARAEIAMIKVAAPNMAQRVIDWAIQAHGGGGVGSDFGLVRFFAIARLLRIPDGPDEVHRNQIAQLELRKWNPRPARAPGDLRAVAGGRRQ